MEHIALMPTESYMLVFTPFDMDVDTLCGPAEVKHTELDSGHCIVCREKMNWLKDNWEEASRVATTAVLEWLARREQSDD